MKKLLSLVALLSLMYHSVKSQTWSLHQQRANLEFTDIKFLNANEGFVFGDSLISGVSIAAVILKTVDGGQTWSTSVLSNPNYSISKTFFLNSNEGFIAGRAGGGNSGLFLKTIDGGTTWINPYIFNGRPFNVCFLNSSLGWVMGKDGFLSKTIDGGITWNTQTITSEDINAMRFFNAAQGVMACDNGELYITNDGGLNWNLVSTPASEDLISIAVNNNSAWICGAAGTLIYSSDAGLTWSLQTAAINIDFNDISFPDGSNGYTAGIAGIINRTQNAGMLWQNQNSNCVDEIVAISVPDVNHGWFCTATGDIYKMGTTTNNSASFTLINQNVFPNPAIENIRISFDQMLPANTPIAVYYLSGQLCLSQMLSHESNDLNISINNLSPGLYMTEVLLTDKKYHSKFIKTNN